MVKGLTRTVVVVKPSGNQPFEQAIFIMRDSAKDADRDSLIKQACNCADNYAREKCGKFGRLSIPAPAFIAVGAAATGLAWLFTLIK